MSVPDKCPKCGSPLEKREGKYGEFLSCTSFPDCRYAFNLSDNDVNIRCPDCGKDLRFRGGKYGQFLGCSGYPNCKLAINPEFKDHPDLFCPKCNKGLETQMEGNQKFLRCKAFFEVNTN